MFVQRIPYQSVRRRRIRHWLLLLMRAAAIALIVAAFARPFFRQGAVAAAAAGGAREVVILLDQSASMGYGDHWQRARDAARTRGRAAWAPTTARRWCCSAATPKRTCARPPTATRLEAGDRRRQGRRPSATRYGPALKLAESILSRSPLKRREAVLISDFQKSRLDRLRRRPLPRGHDADAGVGGVADTDEPRGAVGHLRARVVLRPGAHHRHRRHHATRATRPLKDVPVTLEIDGHEIETEHGQRRRERLRRRCRSRSSRSPSPNVRGIGAAPAPIRCRPTTPSTSC